MDHKILLSKLKQDRIRGMPLDLFQNWLMSQTQFVEINKKESSNVLLLHYGVLQGSVLGPLLFLMYTNDLNGPVTHSKVHHFVDDTDMSYISNWKTFEKHKQEGQLWSKTYCEMFKGKQNFIKFT